MAEQRDETVLTMLRTYVDLYGRHSHKAHIDPHRRYDHTDLRDRDGQMIAAYHALGSQVWRDE